MATLTTADGIQYYFDPNGIVAISDRDPSTATAVTCVYGLSASGYLRIGEGAQQFMTRLNIAAKFAQLTRADGASIWVNGSAVTSIRSRVATDQSGVNAVIFAGSTPYMIKELPAAVAAALHISA